MTGGLRLRVLTGGGGWGENPTLSLVLRLMSRMDRPAACRSRSTSRSLRIVVLLLGMVGSSKKGESLPKGYKINALSRIPAEREQ